MVTVAEKELLGRRLLKPGDVLGVVAGTRQASGSTNSMRLHTVTAEGSLPRFAGKASAAARLRSYNRVVCRRNIYRSRSGNLCPIWRQLRFKPCANSNYRSRKQYGRDLLYRANDSQYVLLRYWNSEQARSTAQEDPELLRCWARLGNEIKILKVYEKLEEIGV